MRINAEECAKILLAQDNIKIICHRDPDADTYGSALALHEALETLGKRATIWCSSPFPKSLEFIHRDMEQSFQPQFIVTVDVADSSMILDPSGEIPVVNLCIDHHHSNSLYAEKTFLSDYPATGEAIFEVLEHMGAKITPSIATALFTAISADTGGLRYSSTTSKTFRISAQLIDSGADFNAVRVALFESRLKGSIKVESEAFAKSNFYCNDRIVAISISQEMLERNKINESELEGISSKTIEIKGVDIGLTLKERTDGSVRISVRTTDKADASAICAQFNGGGHNRASGCRIMGTLAEAEEQLIAVCVAALK